MYSRKKLTEREAVESSQYQFTSLGIGISKGEFNISDVGDILPGAVMVQDLNPPPKLTYMNDWGCEKLAHSLDDLVAMGDDYYKKFFPDFELRGYMDGMMKYVNSQDPTSTYNFYQTVKTDPNREPDLYYTSCKLITAGHSVAPSTQLILTSNPVMGLELTTKKLSKFLDENAFAARNYQKFLLLTSREKEIITLLVEGRSSAEISDRLFISYHTVTTHRKNISKKLDINSFVELVKFANAFDIIRY